VVVKQIWLFTHDQYIDRRIFFFEDVFKDMGFETRIFASHYFDTTTDPDPVSVIRPVNTIIAKKYGIETGQLLPSHKEAVERIITSEMLYHEREGVFTKQLSKLGIRIKELGCSECEIILGEDYFFALLCFSGIVLMYNSYTKQYTLSQYTRIRDYLRKPSSFEAAMYQYIHMDNVESRITINGINLRDYYLDDGRHLIDMNNPQFPLTYSYDIGKQILFEKSPIHSTFEPDDFLGDRRYPYKDFRDHINNYTPIMGIMKEHLKKAHPNFVYVADLPTLPLGKMLKDYTGCKLIIDCHEWWYRNAMLWNASQKKTIDLSEKYERLFYTECDLRITVGKYLAREMSDYYNVPFETVYSCLSTDLNTSIPEPKEGFWQQMLGISKDIKVAIFQGGLTSLRNLNNLARATSYLHDGQALVIVGNGEYEEEFRSIVEKEGNPDVVYYLGWVAQSKLMEYTVNADLGVLPYVAVDEYFSLSTPNKLMEYFTARLPFLFDTSMKEVSDIASETGVGIAANLSDPKEFGLAMASILADEATLQSKKSNYNHFGDRFGYKEQKASFIKILCEYFNLGK
jgi:glycosyltransferase involved in cell wall biosynthesis